MWPYLPPSARCPHGGCQPRGRWRAPPGACVLPGSSRGMGLAPFVLCFIRRSSCQPGMLLLRALGTNGSPGWSSTIGDAVPAPEASDPPPPSSPQAWYAFTRLVPEEGESLCGVSGLG